MDAIRELAVTTASVVMLLIVGFGFLAYQIHTTQEEIYNVKNNIHTMENRINKTENNLDKMESNISNINNNVNNLYSMNKNMNNNINNNLHNMDNSNIINKFWYKWGMLKNKISAKTENQLREHLCFDPSELKTKATIDYYIVISDDQSKHIPVIRVQEWQQNGHLQGFNAAVQDTTRLPPAATPDMVGTQINATKVGYVISEKIPEVADGINIVLLQWGSQLQTVMPYYLATFVILLQLAAIYFNCDLHNALLKYPEFLNLKLDRTVWHDLIITLLKKDPKGPLNQFIQATNGNADQTINNLIDFYIPLFIDYHKEMSHIVEALIKTVG